MDSRPVLFLDVDDTLIGYPGPVVAEYLPEVFTYLTEHFEVRWLTMWCPKGRMPAEYAPQLSRVTSVPLDVIEGIVNPHPFPTYFRGFSETRDKTASIRAMLAETPDREWVWIEDPFLEPCEERFTAYHPDRYIETNTSYDGPDAILATVDKLARMFTLPAFEPAPL